MSAALALKLGQGEFTVRCSTALKADVGETRGAVIKLAEITNTNPRTAKNWLHGYNAPDALNLLRLMAELPTFRSEMRRLAGMDTDLDPELERDLAAVVARFQRLKGQGA